MNEVKGLALTFQHLNAFFTTRHVDGIEQDRTGGEQTEIDRDFGTIRALQRSEPRGYDFCLRASG